jgi:hypothetical protein
LPEGFEIQRKIRSVKWKYDRATWQDVQIWPSKSIVFRISPNTSDPRIAFHVRLPRKQDNFMFLIVPRHSAARYNEDLPVKLAPQ